ncbi:MAG: sigma-54 dependent transcriptional regulator [Chitinophagales bacterium]|nr:sigma-54-dependent Fis family transcriptional regulator [Bacteroidota bacterium]MCB9042732.1 sigma-54-dependent Fis family transcriptional regulator [Chitinophagales bacterium]
MAKILIVDDEKNIRRTLREILEYEGYTVEEAEDGVDGLNQIKINKYDLVFLDIKMPKLDGLEVLAQALEFNPELPIIIISGHGTMETAVEAVRNGAFDYIAKPPDLNRLLITVRNALDRSSLISESKNLKRRINKTREIIGASKVIKKIKETIDRVAPTDARVLITGSNGTGKELVARWLHEKSNRSEGPMIEVNCAAIPSELIESELFGHEKGAFTSAVKQRIGKFELANGGTLFLDEVGDMSLSAQAKVLRALQENKITRVGGDREIPVNVRIVAATNKNLLEQIAEKKFREDLYHRLAVLLVHVPSLDERKEDIPLLAEMFTAEICADYNMKPKAITPEALTLLQELHWSGNVRELHNVIERLVILSDKSITDKEVRSYVSPNLSGSTSSNIGGESVDFDSFPNFSDYKDYAEKVYLEFKLQKNNWNVSKTAEEIEIQRSHLYNKIDKFNLKR